MATTVTPPAAGAPPPSAPTLQAPASPPPSLADRIAATVAAAKAERDAPSPTSAPAPPTGAAPQQANPPAEAPPVEGQPSTSVAPPPASIDDIDLEEVIPAAASEASQPAVDASGPTQDDPLALVNKVAAGLGIQPELLTTTPEGRQILSSLRWRGAIEAPPTEDGRGGLGYLPSANEVTDAFQAAAAMDAFELAFESKPQDAILYLTAPDFNPQTGRYSLRPGAVQFLTNLPQVLDKLGQVTFGNGATDSLTRIAAQPFLAKAAEELYSVLQTPAEEYLLGGQKFSKDQVLAAAQVFERAFFNKNRTAKATPEPDDVRQQREQLQAANQQRQAQAQAHSDRMAGDFRQAVIGSAADRVTAAVDKVMRDSGLAANVPEYALPALRDQIVEEAINMTSGNAQLGIQPISPLQYQRWETMLERWTNAARTAIRKDGVQIMSDHFYRLAQNNIKAAARKILQPQVANAAAANGAVHAAARNGASRVEPGATPGTAQPQSVVAATPQERQPNESREDYGKRLLTDKLNLARSQGQLVRR